jgi:hypothetical protein
MIKNVILIVALYLAPISSGASVCINNICGKLVCPRGCVQQVVNGQCVANYCNGRVAISSDSHPNLDTEEFASEEELTPEYQENGLMWGDCVSCVGGCCHSGGSFMAAERACKAHHGAFGCFTRCD